MPEAPRKVITPEMTKEFQEKAKVDKEFNEMLERDEKETKLLAPMRELYTKKEGVKDAPYYEVKAVDSSTSLKDMFDSEYVKLRRGTDELLAKKNKDGDYIYVENPDQKVVLAKGDKIETSDDYPALATRVKEIETKLASKKVIKPGQWDKTLAGIKLPEGAVKLAKKQEERERVKVLKERAIAKLEKDMEEKKMSQEDREKVRFAFASAYDNAFAGTIKDIFDDKKLNSKKPEDWLTVHDQMEVRNYGYSGLFALNQQDKGSAGAKSVATVQGE